MKDSARIENVQKLLVLVGMFSFVFFVYQTSLVLSYDPTNVTSRANMTDSAPEVISVIIDESVNGANNISLAEGGNRSVYCNVTLRDFGGVADLDVVNATFYHHDTVSATDPDDRNNHYTNSTCVRYNDDGGQFANYSCVIEVTYFANPGNWTCLITADDLSNNTNTGFNTTIVSELYAINLSTSEVNYGQLTRNQISANQTINITNVGNTDVNITIVSYGATPTDGLDMVCESNNITVGSQRFSATETGYTSKTQTSIGATLVPDLTVLQQTDDTTLSTNTTYWQLQVTTPDNPFGVCNGTIVFEATAS